MTPEQIAAELESALCAPDWAASLAHVHNAIAALASQPVPAPDLAERAKTLLHDECSAHAEATVVLGEKSKGYNQAWQDAARLLPDFLARAIIPIIQADEREECAKVAETKFADGMRSVRAAHYRHAGRQIATAIRERNGG